MAVVQAQVAANATPATPVLLFTATADSVANVFCVNPTTAAADAFVEVRLQDAAQADEHLLTPGHPVPPVDRVVEGPIYLASGDTVYVYGEDAAQVFSLFGQTL